MTVRCELQKNAAGSKGALSLILKGEYSDKDLPLRTFLLKHRLSLTGKVEIPPTTSYDFFALMATGGELYYQNKRLLVDFEHAELLHYFDVDLHRAAFNEDVLTAVCGSLNDVDDTFKLRREGADDKAAFYRRDNLFHVFTHGAFRERKARLFTVG